MSDSNADSKANTKETIYIVSQCVDYVNIICVKRSHSAAVNAVFKHVIDNGYPFGDEKMKDEKKKVYLLWIVNLSDKEVSEFGKGSYSPMFCNLLDDYKLNIDTSHVEDD